MAADLGTGIPLVGHLQTVFAVACGFGGPVLARLLGRFDRKHLLMLVMLTMTCMNIACAMAPGFTVIAAIRIAGGLFAALTLPLASTIAVNMVPEAKRPAAIATVLSGYTLAFLIGMPVCTLIGDAMGWRAAFGFAAALCILAFGVIALAAPSGVSGHMPAGAGFKAALRGDNPLLLAVTLLGFAATFATVSFVGPMITAFSGLQGAAIGGIQVATGIGSLLGLPAGAALARLALKGALSSLLCVTAITQLVFSLGMSMELGWLAAPVLVVNMALGSAALFATSPVIQNRLAQTAGDSATIAFALNGSMVYFGQGIGVTLGGSVIAMAGIQWIGVAGSVVAIAGLMVIMFLDKPAFVNDR